MAALNKYISLLIIMFCSFLLLGCSVPNVNPKANAINRNHKTIVYDELKGVWMETEYETYGVGVTSIKAKWYNSFNDRMMFGQPFVLERKVNGKWKEVKKETSTNYGFTLEGIILNSNDTRWHTYDLIPYTNGLSSGDYRISATFIRNTLNGKDYGAGYYPSYQAYGYFKVGDESIKRNLTILDHTKFEYLNDEYHFGIYLPKEWQGLQVLKEQKTGNKNWDELFSKIDKNYTVLNIRHPKWTKEMPYQDISFVIFRTKEWNKNLDDAIHGNYDLLPPTVPGGDTIYVIRLNPTAYNNTLIGYEEVLKLIGTDYFNSSVHDY
jgi:hypothetical protein